MDWTNLIYLAAATLFIVGLKGLTHPRTAVRGNLIGSMAMLLAVVVAMVYFFQKSGYDKIGIAVVLAGLALGSAIGVVLAVKIEMTAMPQLVALFNGFGGLASVLVASAAAVLPPKAVLAAADPQTGRLALDFSLALAASGIIGAVTFSGSLIAFGKLQELAIFKRPLGFNGQQAANTLLAVVVLAIAAWMIVGGWPWLFLPLVLLALVLGVLLVMPIGGADMPVVIALLNSYSGLAAAATGFVIGNTVLIVAGSLVGASGVVLTRIMCKAMNRSLFNVLFGVMGPGGGEQGPVDDIYEGKIKSAGAEEVAMLYDNIQRAVIVPGYGMAVAQAQHAVRELTNVLEERGIEVEFAIHPVAGRMPGHMNVLLAEAEIPYEKLKEMDVINPSFPQVDVALVIGANDVVNPVARTDPNSPIAGMPILDVDKARTVVVIKRSLSPGFAGIANPLFVANNTYMFFGDGKKAVLDLIGALKES